MSRHRVMTNLDYNEELSDAEVNDGPLDDEVDEEAMREGIARVTEALGDKASFISRSQIEQALWDSYYDADEAVKALSEIQAEEEAKMNDAAADVLQRLGENSDKVTPKQMQDAIWHYYYDIDKVVGYLDRTYVNPPEKPKPKAKAPPIECKYIQLSSSANSPGRAELSGRGGERSATGGGPGYREAKRTRTDGYMLAPRIEVPPEWHFWDTPWLGAPLANQSVLVGPPRVGGLLGGSSGGAKPSKLQALAAARKNKRAGDKKESESGTDSLSQPATPSGPAPVAKKDDIKLDIRLLSRRGTRPGPDQSRGETSSQSPDVTEGRTTDKTQPSNTETEQSSDSLPKPEVEPCVMPEVTRPSPFAATLFGPSDNAPTPQNYPLPYTAAPSFSAKPFLQPSPDDVVLAAQSQGSRFAGK